MKKREKHFTYDLIERALLDRDYDLIRSWIDDGITRDHGGKMKGFWSFSTSVLNNENCRKHSLVRGSVCAHCYAQKYAKMRHQLADKLRRNLLLISSFIYPKECFPLLNCAFFRLEAFGDITNSIHVKNYFTFCEANPQVRFALWTKNPHIIEQAINEGAVKPSNLVIVYSPLFLNTCPMSIFEKYDFIDKIFCVYDQETIDREGVVINCGAKNCLACHICYFRDTEKVIREKLK